MPAGGKGRKRVIKKKPVIVSEKKKPKAKAKKKKSEY
jgi:hypothetical protein